MYYYDPYFKGRMQPRPPRPPHIKLPVAPQNLQPQSIPGTAPGQWTQWSLSPQSLQPQIAAPNIQPQTVYPPVYPPIYPPPPVPTPTVGGCTQKWATMRLRDGRTLNVYVTSIAEKSLGGFLPSGQQIALDLDEIMEMTC